MRSTQADATVEILGTSVADDTPEPLLRRADDALVYVWVGYLVLMLVLAIFGEAIAPYDPTSQDVLSRLLPPLETSRRGFHLMGTDALGRDLFSQIIVATRLTLFIGAVGTAIGLIIGVAVGLGAGYYG